MAVLKLLRNQTLYATHEEALSAINAKAQELGDGELWIATYGAAPNAKSILALKRTDGLTVFDNETSSDTITAAINALDATVGSTTVENGKHVAVQVVETDGKLTALTVTESDIASKKALDDEIAALKAADTTLTQNLAAEVDRAKLAETSIDSVVGLTKADNGETRTYTNEGEYIGKKAAGTNTVASDIKALDTKLKGVADGLAAVRYKVSGTTLEFFGISGETVA